MRRKTFLRKTLKAIFRPREIVITIVAFMLIGLLRFVAIRLDVFNPIARAVQGFSTTDIFYDMMMASPADTSDVIVIVDITKLHDRDSIATIIEEVDALAPAAIDIDVGTPTRNIRNSHGRHTPSSLKNLGLKRASSTSTAV